ncbi:MAG TPA: oligosaccharide flippase family protein [archaeon]|nr:oligosaccharide flippase family protein [archaeon]
MGLGKKLISNTTFLLTDWIFVSIFSFLFWLVIGKLLSKADYGTIATVVNAGLILASLSSLGFGPVITKLIPEYMQRRKQNLANALIKFSFRILIVTNILIIITTVLFSQQISSILKIPQLHVIMIGVITFAVALSNFGGSILQGMQRMKQVATTDFLGHIIKSVGTAALLFLYLNNFIPLITFAITFFAIFFLRFRPRWLTGKTDGLNYREIVSKYVLLSFVGSIGWMIFTNAQYVILTAIQDPATTGVFSVAAIITTVIAVIPVNMTSALFPILSQLSVSSTFEKQQKYFLSVVLRYALLVAIPIAAVFIFFPTKIIILFSRAEFLDAKSLFSILSIAAIFNGIGSFFLSSLYALKKVRENTMIIVGTAAIFLALALIMTYMFSAMGLAVAYTIAMFFLFSASFYQLRKLVHIRLPILNIAKIVIATVAFILLASFLLSISTNFIIQSAMLAVSFIVYPFVLLPLKFYNDDDLKVMRFLKERLPGKMGRLLNTAEQLIMKFR